MSGRIADGKGVAVPNPINPITYNELHAALIGTSGLFFGLLWSSGSAAVSGMVGSVSALMAAYAVFGYPVLGRLQKDAPGYRTAIGLKTIKTEPWWFLTPFTLLFLLTGYVLPVLGRVV